MKRYISAILIPCMLFQIYGCSTNKYITKEEIVSNYYNQPVEILTKDNREFILKKNIDINEIEKYSQIGYCSDYQIEGDTLVLYKNKVGYTSQKDKNGITIKRIEIDKILIPESLIHKIRVSEYSSGRTSALYWSIAIAVGVGLVAIIYYNLKNSNKSLL